MDLERMLSSRGFMRLVLVVWVVCTVFLVVLFKNMEHIVHIQLYEYGLVLNHAWLDPYRLCSSLIYYGCLLPPLVLSGVALVSSFFKESDEVPRKMNTASRRSMAPHATKVESRPVGREAPKRVESGRRNGISCPHCGRTFGRALVMLDFRGGKNQLVSVCPYCSCVLGNTSDRKGLDGNVRLAPSDEKIIH